MATYCDPTVDTVQDKSCEFPDSRLLDLRKGTNPRFLAYQANRVRYQRTKQVNDMARTCDSNLSNCQYTPVTHKGWNTNTSNGGMNIYKQSLSDQPNYILQNGEYVPSGRLEIQRRTHLDYVASVDQGQTIGDARQQEFFRNNQRDARQCLLYGTRCGALSNAGVVSAGLPSKDAGLNAATDNKATLGDKYKAQGLRDEYTADGQKSDELERRGLGYDDFKRGNGYPKGRE